MLKSLKDKQIMIYGESETATIAYEGD
jgi:hypothetical protein